MFFSGDERNVGGVVPVFESLEERQYLTTVVGGETFEYIDANDQTVRISLSGEIIAEFIGADLAADNRAMIGGLSGTVYSSPFRNGSLQLGGLNGYEGVDLIGPLVATPDDEFSMECLASDTSGATFGFSIVEVPDPLGGTGTVPDIQLWSVNTTTGEATPVALVGMTGPLPWDSDGEYDVSTISAADFRPLDGSAREGYLYFTITGEADGNEATFLYSLDVNDPVNTMARHGQIAGTEVAVGSIVWEEYGPGQSTLLGYFYDDPNTTSSITQINPATGASLPFTYEIFYEDSSGTQTPIDNIVGMEFVHDDPTARYDDLYLVQSDGANTTMLRVRVEVDPATGVVIDGTIDTLGVLRDIDGYDPAATPQSRRGEELGGVAWNPTVFNPYTGDYGALIATDYATDELVILDYRERFETADLYYIHIVHAGPDASLSIAVVPADDPLNPPPTRDMQPYTGNSGALRINPSDGGDLIAISSGAGTGGVFIGARTMDIDDSTDDEQDRAILQAIHYGAIGNLPSEFDEVGADDDDTQVNAGIAITENLLELYGSGPLASNMFQFNFDRVDAFTVSRDGAMYVVDSDLVDRTGTLMQGSEIAQIDPATGQLVTVDPFGNPVRPMPIINDDTNNPIIIRAMDYGDVDFDGNEEIYAIGYEEYWSRQGGAVFGTINPATGSFHYLGTMTVAGVALAFSPGAGSNPSRQGLYMVGSNNTLYEIDPSDGTTVSTIGAITADKVDADGVVVTAIDPNTNLPYNVTTGLTIESMDFDENGRLYGHDTSFGRLVDIDVATGLAGYVVATTPGSLRPMVGAIAYDYSTDTFLAVDNSISQNYNKPDPLSGAVNENSVDDNDEPLADTEGAILFSFSGIESLPQTMNKILIGGTVTGTVDLAASLNTFYAGWILTGNALGEADEAAPSYPGNFNVDGDLRNLLSKGTIGGSDNLLAASSISNYLREFLSGFDLVVGGKLGWVASAVDVLGSVTVFDGEVPNDLDAQVMNQTEIERLYFNLGVRDPEGVAFENYDLYDPNSGSFFLNDSYATPQYVGSIRTGVAGEDDVTRVSGSVQLDALPADPSDWYAISLDAGQTVEFQLISYSSSATTSSATINVYNGEWLDRLDPAFAPSAGTSQGLLVTRDISDTDPTAISQQTLRFTADKPGIYRIQITASASPLAEVYYTFEVRGIGDMAIGAITAGNAEEPSGDTGVIYGSGAAPAINAVHGDIGVVSAGEALIDEIGYFLHTGDGALRAIVSNSFGLVDATPTAGVSFTLAFDPAISIGGNLGIASCYNDATGLYFATLSVGGNVGVLESANDFYGELYIDGGIGVIRVGSIIMGNVVTIIQVNADGVGHDGIIDLIDVAGDMGAPAVGGPQISTGPGGDVRYMRVGGEIYSAYGTYEATGYGRPWPVEVTVDFAQMIADGEDPVIKFVDDSGATIYLELEARLLDPTIGPVFTDPTITYRSFGIIGGGGVLVEVQTAENLRIYSETNASHQYAEIGAITLLDNPAGTARAVSPDLVTGRPVLDPDLGYNVELIIDDYNNNPVDVLNVTGTGITSLVNYSAGEIVNVNADSIGRVYTAGTIGFARRGIAGEAVNPRTVLYDTDTPPFGMVRNAMVVTGSVAVILSEGAIGNLEIGGEIGWIEAGYLHGVDHTANDYLILAPEGNDPESFFRGIVGNVHATGDIWDVRIGEGLAPSGRGDYYQAGLFSNGRIHWISNDGVGSRLGSDIRGDIMCIQGIGRIELFSGSIIDADISPTEDADLDTGMEDVWAQYLITPGGPTVSYGIDLIRITGFGGIIGSNFRSGDIGEIQVIDGAYGIINSNFRLEYATNSIGDITVSGFGMIDVGILAGNNVGNITLLGNGNLWDATEHSEYTVRYSQDYSFDPVFDETITSLNDLHMAIGTSVASPTQPTGVMENVYISGLGRLGAVAAYTIISTASDGVTLVPPAADAHDRLLSSTFNFNRMVGFAVKSDIYGMAIESGNVGYFRPRGDVYALDMQVSGRINNININGDLAGSSYISSNGPNGFIGSVRVAGTLDGYLRSTGWIGSVLILGDLIGGISVDSVNASHLSLRSLTVNGSFSNGSLDVDGSVGAITVRGDFGAAGDWLLVTGDLGSLNVGSDPSVDGSLMNMDLAVTGNVGSIVITGASVGDIYVGGDLGRMIVRGDDVTTGGVLLDGDLDVRGGINTLQLIGGSLDAEVLAGLSLGAIRISDGDVAADARVSSAFGDIALVDVRDGDLLGTIQAHNGAIRSLLVSGDFGAAAKVLAESLTRFDVSGSMLTGGAVTIDGPVDSFYLGGDMQTGVAVSGRAGGRYVFTGSVAGSLMLTDATDATSIRIGGNLDGDIATWSALSLDIAGAMQATASVFADGDLDSLKVDGSLSGSFYVNGAGGVIRAGSLDGAILAIGYDLKSLLVAGAMDNSLVQVGLSVGADGVFGTGDAREGGRIAELKLLTAGSMTNSVVASAGDLNTVRIDAGLTGSSISTGLNLGSAAVAAVAADATPLADALELAAARGGADRQLFAGDMLNVNIGLGGLAASALTAGIDPGADGDFGTGDDAVLTSLTGGTSVIRRLNADVNAGSVALADGGVLSHVGSQAGTVSAVDYTMLDIAPGAINLKDTASAGNPATFVTAAGDTYTVSVSGPGSARLYDEVGADTDNLLDLLYISGTTAATRISVTSDDVAGAQIARVATADDTAIGTLDIAGAIVGDGTAAADLWLDAGARTIEIDDLGGDGWTGAIGGDVTSMAVGAQHNGILNIGGEVRKMSILSGDGYRLFGNAQAADTDSIYAVAADFGGAIWAWDSATSELYMTGGYPATAVTVTDLFGDTPDISAMDFAAGNVLYVVASLNNPIPNAPLADPTGGQATLRTLAVAPTGDLYAIGVDFVGDGNDWLVRIDPDTGAIAGIGALRDIYSNTFSNTIMAMTFSQDGDLIALTADRDGNGAAYDAGDGAALVAIALSDPDQDGFIRVYNPDNAYAPVARLNGGGETLTFKAMTTAADGTIYAVRREADNSETLVTIDEAAATTADIGTIQFNLQDTDIVGIGFSAAGGLVAYNNDGAGAELLAVNTATPSSSQLATVAGILDDTIDSYAMGNGIAFAYNTDNVLGVEMYTSYGQSQTPGIVDTDTGDLLIMPALVDADGNAITSTIRGFAIDNNDTGDLFVLSGSDLLQYDRADGSFVAYHGEVQVSGNAATIYDMDFDDLTGRLVALEGYDGGFYLIDTASATTAPIEAVALTAPGVVNVSQVGSFAIDPVDGSLTATSFRPDGAGGTVAELISASGLASTSQQGIIAQSVTTLMVGEKNGAGYSSRVATRNGSLRKVTAKGEFTGTLFADGDVTSFLMSDGNFGGTLSATGALGAFRLRGDVLPGGNITAGEIRTLDVSGEFLGFVGAVTAGSLNFRGTGVSPAYSFFDYANAGVSVASVRSLNFAGAFYGLVEVDEATSLSFGSLGSYALVAADADVSRLRVSDGMASTAAIAVYGELDSLVVSGTLSGLIAVQRGLGHASLGDMDGGLLNVALDSGVVRAASMVDSVLAFGTWIGSDLIYNTADDLITGGSVRTVVVGGRIIDSAIVAGVLPDESFGPGIPNDMRAFIGNANASDMAQVDSAEAGGILQSHIGRIVAGDAINTARNSGMLSVAAAADSVGPIRIRRKGAFMTSREYTDPFGPPSASTPVWSSNATILTLTFSEEINTSSLVLSVDQNNDGDVTDAGDTQGTITITDIDGNVLDDVTISYRRATRSDGTTYGVVSLYRFAGFPDDITVNLGARAFPAADIDGNAILDRSGLRSALRDFNQDGVSELFEDTAGTVLEGDGDRKEGIDLSISVLTTDVGGTFAEAYPAPVTVDGAFTQMKSTLATLPSGDPDVDVFQFTAQAGQFFGMELLGGSAIQFGLFMLDDQGTVLPDDDTYEALAAMESPVNGYQFQAFELWADGTYYVVLGGGTGSYTLNMLLASSDDMLDGVLDGEARIPTGEQIAYVSNTVGENNNLLGHSDPKQLIYLNFDGGTTVDFAANYDVEALDLSVINSALAGYENAFINGDGALGITGVVDHLLHIFQDVPAGFGVNVQLISDAAAWNAATDGLYFTLVDPATWDLDPTEDFTTVFVGNASNNQLLEASNLDFANQDHADEVLVNLSRSAMYQFFLLSDISEDVVNDYTVLIANNIARGLGTTFGFDEQAQGYLLVDVYFLGLLDDDPDNVGVPANGNLGLPMMAQYSYFDIADFAIWADTVQLGTQWVENFTDLDVFVDTMELTYRWFH